MSPCFPDFSYPRSKASEQLAVGDRLGRIDCVHMYTFSTRKNASNNVTIAKKMHEAKDIRVESLALTNVSFRYPARPSVLVLDDVSLVITRGQKVAFVGESGSGKSTIVSLFERFYDPEKGQVLINGEDIKTIAPHARDHLRNMFGYVGQVNRWRLVT